MNRAFPMPRTSSIGERLDGWRGHIFALGSVSLAIILLFVRDVTDMAAIWWGASTYGHCLFIPFLIAWLVQQRLGGLRRLNPVAWWPGLLWLGAGALCWLAGDAASVALFRHLGVVIMLQGAAIAILGANVSRALAFPIFYGFFLIPFGEEVVPTLQLLTAKLAAGLLGIAGVPAHLDGIFISTPTGYFEVAEACSGAKFLIAMTAYAVLVCNVCFRSWGRRIAFMMGAQLLSILANGVRAFATIYVAHLTTVDAAVGFDHVVYGWVFFALIMTVTMAIAWPFFDRKPGDAVFDPAMLQSRFPGAGQLAYVAPAALALAAFAPLWSYATAARAEPVPSNLALPQVPGWQRSDAPQAFPWMPRFDGADHLALGRYHDSHGVTVDLAIAVFDRQEEKRELVGFGQGAIDPQGQWVWSSPARAPADARGEQITAPGPVVRHVVSFYALNGVVTGSAGKVKLETLKARLLGGDQRAVAILVSAEQADGAPADAAIAAFLRDLGSIKELADASAGIR
ncbi:exosortase A [Sphingobium phenoxybenzoativorans]|uniref:exosortase A n=1 Tax=Sphingobium phenoxybenzoativorans TaxID=1592790 RepID=UPI0008725B71|nr:EpsI domain-containing exosortase [Sphingobium phenoxybenzoativorans]